jgi:hypothetical protein
LARRAGGGRIGGIDFGRIGGTQAGGEGDEQNPTVFFHWQLFVLRREKCAFVPGNASCVSNGAPNG